MASVWVAVLSWLGEHSPPLIAGFCGGIVGGMVREIVMRKRKGH